MKKVGFITVLGVAAVLGAYVWLDHMPQNSATSGATKVVGDVKHAVAKTQEIVSKQDQTAPQETEQSNVQGTVHKEFSAESSDGASAGASAQMKITAYVPDLQDISYTDDNGVNHLFHVEIAERQAERQRGLMFRHEMPEDQGMLFVFEDEAPRSFWMKNTYIPLDMFFIRADGTIDSIRKNAIPLDTSFINSDGPAQFVLEVNAGTADKFGIKVGDKFHNENFAN